MYLRNNRFDVSQLWVFLVCRNVFKAFDAGEPQFLEQNKPTKMVKVRKQ